MSIDLTECKAGNHQFEQVYSYMDYFDGPDDVVRWCKICGTVVVDQQRVGRLISSGPLRASALFKERLKEDA